MNLPNKLTLLRLIMVPFFMVAMAIPELFTVSPAAHVACNITGVVLFILASATDFLDGNIARKYGLVTNFGKFMDPLADKLMQCAALICLAVAGMVGYWYIIPYIFKELALLFCGFLVIKRRSFVTVSNIFGKFAAFFFYVVIGLVMLLSDPDPVKIEPWVNIICAISLFFTLLAFAVYFIGFFREDAKRKADMAKSETK